MQSENRSPLSGIRVIEAGAFIAGPFCGQLLADFGADVIKVEPPGTGDPMRQWGLHKKDGQSLWWPVIGRNKRSVTLDLRHATGQDLARRLIRTADVLVENFRPGALERWNLDPEKLRQEHPALIVARVSGFGQTGPYRDRPGFAAVCEAMAGMRNLTGYADRPPVRVGLSIGDSLAGVFAAFGVLNALYVRDRGISRQSGQTVDAEISESVLAVMESVISEYSATKQIRQREGTTLPGIAPSNIYPAKDGSWVIIGANSDSLFQRLARAMERSELAADKRYATHQARGEHQVELDEIIARWTATLNQKDLLEAVGRHGVPAGPVYDAADVAGDPHYRARGAIVDVPVGTLGTISMQGVAPQLSETPGQVRWTGPALGEHNAEVYGGLLGLSEEKIEELRGQGIV
jgi:formyl-CoA transferase/succinyl-CoA--D-citramalate CoA-transferase